MQAERLRERRGEIIVPVQAALPSRMASSSSEAKAPTPVASPASGLAPLVPLVSLEAESAASTAPTNQDPTYQGPTNQPPTNQSESDPRWSSRSSGIAPGTSTHDASTHAAASMAQMGDGHRATSSRVVVRTEDLQLACTDCTHTDAESRRASEWARALPASEDGQSPFRVVIEESPSHGPCLRRLSSSQVGQRLSCGDLGRQLTSPLKYVLPTAPGSHLGE